MAFLPAALPIIGAVAGIAGTAIGGISAWQQGKYQAQVAKNNAAIAKMNAERASDAAQVEQLRSDREYAAKLGEVRALQAASGLDILGKSQFMTRESLSRIRGEAAKDIRLEGVAESQRFFQDAANFQAEASAAKASGRNALIASAFDIAGQGASLIGKSRSTKSKYKSAKGAYR